MSAAAERRRAELRARILAALLRVGPMTGPVTPRQRRLSQALDYADDDRHAEAARLLLREVSR
jgi:hypothetical protein